jgi:hypothetical protein
MEDHLAVEDLIDLVAPREVTMACLQVSMAHPLPDMVECPLALLLLAIHIQQTCGRFKDGWWAQLVV